MVAHAKAGTAHLRFAPIGAHTALTRAFCASPAKLIATNRNRVACWVYASTLGGGLVGGDDMALSIDVTSGARALLTSQASTKVYRSTRRSQQRVTASVANGGLLAVLPDPIVCYTGADFVQTQHYDLHGDATLVVVDWITSGRHECGERWAFSRYESRFTVNRDGQSIFFDAVVLEPEAGRIAARMGQFNVLLTAVMTGAMVNGAAGEVVRRIAAQPVIAAGRASGPLVTASALRPHGAVLRIAGTSAEQVGLVLREHLAFLSPLVGDDLWSRKW
jgi:urease accessory protein